MGGALKRCLWIAALIWLSAAAPVRAQEGMWVRGLGGLTFGAADPSSIFGGAFGASLTPNLHVTGEAGRMQNVMPGVIQDLFDLFELLFEVETGVSLDLDVTARALYGMGGMRYNIPTTMSVQPFVDAQLGVASISFDIEAEADGVDISEEVEAESDVPEFTEVIMALGGGVAFRLSESLELDVGYRFHRIFTEDPGVNVSAVYGALRVMFR
jgi:opacity protein-like surface antigen